MLCRHLALNPRDFILSLLLPKPHTLITGLALASPPLYAFQLLLMLGFHCPNCSGVPLLVFFLYIFSVPLLSKISFLCHFRFLLYVSESYQIVSIHSLPFLIRDVHTGYLLNHVWLFKRWVFPLVLSVVPRDTRSHDTIQGHLSISCFAFLPKHLVSQVKCFNQLWYKL